MPLSETALPGKGLSGDSISCRTDVEVVVTRCRPLGPAHSPQPQGGPDAREAEEVREYTERADVTPQRRSESLADNSGALSSRGKVTSPAASFAARGRATQRRGSG